MIPNSLNPFPGVEDYEEQRIGPWQNLGLTTAEEAAMMEGITTRTVVSWNLLYTIYEYTYYQSRWEGVQYGLPSQSGGTATGTQP